MSSREAVRNARGYTPPLCGELNTTGPCHSAGSRISKGGSSSSFSSDISVWTFQLGRGGWDWSAGRLWRPGSNAGSALFATTIAENALLSNGQRRMPRSVACLKDLGQVRAGSPVIYPASGLWDAGKHGWGAVRSPSAAGWTMAKIILAEDDGDMRRFLVKALQNAGYEVISFDNGLSAYQRLREEPFELLLTDIVMPEMDGIELARRASELDPDIKIMFITGFAAVALNSASAAPKNAKVLSKPVHLRELVNEVQKLLAA